MTSVKVLASLALGFSGVVVFISSQSLFGFVFGASLIAAGFIVNGSIEE